MAVSTKSNLNSPNSGNRGPEWLSIRTLKLPASMFRPVLTLPMWERASGQVYDMLVGHEVGHALYTLIMIGSVLEIFLLNL